LLNLLTEKLHHVYVSSAEFTLLESPLDSQQNNWFIKLSDFNKNTIQPNTFATRWLFWIIFNGQK